jgi:predicted enzyme related to lactoylglutathione lyase
MIGVISLCGVTVAQAPAGAPAIFPGAPATSPAPTGDVLNAGPFIHVVTNLDRTLAFYEDPLGVKAKATTPAAASNAAVAKMYNAPGARVRSAILTIPHTDLSLEFVELQGAKLKSPVAARVWDTGAANILLRIREIEIAAASVLAHGGSIVNPTGQPVVAAGIGGAVSTQFLIVRDPDGYFVELIDQYAEKATPENGGNVVTVLFRFIADDAGKTASFFQQAFGFDVTAPGTLAKDPVLGAMTGLGSATSRFTRSVVPGSKVVFQIGEIKTPDSRRLDQTLPRVGASMFRLEVRDLDGTLARAKAAGAVLAPGNEQPTTVAPGRRMVLITEPDGLLLQLAESR